MREGGSRDSVMWLSLVRGRLVAGTPNKPASAIWKIQHAIPSPRVVDAHLAQSGEAADWGRSLEFEAIAEEASIRWKPEARSEPLLPDLDSPLHDTFGL